MAGLTPFTSRLGVGQGRIAPGGAPAHSGDHAFVLGEDAPGRIYTLAEGDHVEVLQETDLTDVDLLRAHLTLRTPADVPEGLAWEAQIVVDGAALARVAGRPGRTRDLTDLAANVSKLSGVHTIGVRLELIAAGG